MLLATTSTNSTSHLTYYLPTTSYSFYTSTMPCRDLAALRAEATELSRMLAKQRAAARSSAHLERGGHPPGHSDYEPLLKRKIERLAVSIQKHKAEHGCED